MEKERFTITQEAEEQPREFAMRIRYCKDLSKNKEVKQVIERVDKAIERWTLEAIKDKPICQLSIDEIEFYLKHKKKYDTGHIASLFWDSPEKFAKLIVYLEGIADRCRRLEKTEERFVERSGGFCNPPFYGYYKWNGTATLFYYLTEKLNDILKPQWESRYKWNVYLYLFGYPFDFEQMKYTVKNNKLNKPKGYRVLDSLLKNI